MEYAHFCTGGEKAKENITRNQQRHPPLAKELPAIAMFKRKYTGVNRKNTQKKTQKKTRKRHRAESSRSKLNKYLSWPLGGPPRMGATMNYFHLSRFCRFGLSMSSNGAACTSTLRGDFKYETCAPFCSSKLHCQYCKCKTCSVCNADEAGKKSRKSKKSSRSIGGAVLSPGRHSKKGSTVQEGLTERFDHYCQEATCQRFCSERYKHWHCNDCKCKACGFCAQYKCMQPSCDDWCLPEHKRYRHTDSLTSLANQERT